MADGWLVRVVKALVLCVVAMAAASVLAFAVAAMLAMAAVCLIALLTAYVVSPKDVKAVVGAFTEKMDAWMKDAKELVQSMIDVVKTVTEAAKNAAGIVTPAAQSAENKPTPTAEATPAESDQPAAEDAAPVRKPRRRRHWTSHPAKLEKTEPDVPAAPIESKDADKPQP